MMVSLTASITLHSGHIRTLDTCLFNMFCPFLEVDPEFLDVILLLSSLKLIPIDVIPASKELCRVLQTKLSSVFHIEEISLTECYNLLF